MTHELRIERLLDAPPELVFDTLVGADAKEDLYNGQIEGWALLGWEMDLREGGTWTMLYGPEDGSTEPDRLTSVFTEVDRPRRLSYDLSMFVGEWGRTVDSSVTYTFEERDGGTLLTIVQSGFETKEVRDSYLDGAPGFLDSLERAVAARAAR
jgi:uncharacterized protein YndB with AHSA1/START domain